MIRFKESVASLQAYFLLVGFVGSASYLYLILGRFENTVLVALTGFGITYSFALLFVGFNLRTLLRKFPHLIKTVLVAGLSFQALSFKFWIFEGIQASIISPSIIMIPIYAFLIKSVSRLSLEIQEY